MDPIALIKTLLKNHSGFQIRPDESSRIERILKDRVRDMGLGSLEEFARLLARDSEELGSLSETLTVNESYFFRDKGQLDVLRKRIIPDLIEAGRPTKRLRIWSAGCSTGEEPYTLAILVGEVLEDPAWNVDIVGTDLDARALETATHGRYRAWSLRSVDPAVRARYFEQAGDGWDILPGIRNRVRFHRQNLTTGPIPDINRGIWNLDLVVCRNVFIYLEQQTVARILGRMRAALRVGGYLVTGHGELYSQDLDGFESQVFDESVVYRRTESDARSQIGRESGSPVAVSLNRPPRVEHVDTPMEETGTAAGPLDRARMLADRGQFEEAVRLAEAAVASEGADALFLLAQIEQESGSPDGALEFLRKCIYLWPDYLPAHLELASIYEQLGTPARAQPLYRTALSMIQNQSEAEPVLPGDARTRPDWVAFIEAKLNHE